MKRIIFSVFLILNTLLLTGCLPPILQGASTLNTVMALTNDRRSAGEIIDDNTIAFRLATWAGQDKIASKLHLNFTIFSKVTLITGEVPNAEIRAHIASEAQLQAPKISYIFDEMTIGKTSSLYSRAKDTAITTKIGYQFNTQKSFRASHIKITTENQVVYLMGSVTHEEAQVAAKIATKTSGVKKVITLFDVLLKLPSAELALKKIQQVKIDAEKYQQQQAHDRNTQRAELRKQLRALDKLELGTSDFTPVD